MLTRGSVEDRNSRINNFSINKKQRGRRLKRRAREYAVVEST